MAQDCSVCCEKINKSNRKPVVCGFCSYQSCISCAKAYLLGSTMDPHCMSCRKAWNREFMDEMFSKTFMNSEYKKHRENVLIDRERSLLPATMPYAEDVKRARTYRKEQKDVKNRLSALVHGATFYNTPRTLERCDKEEEHEIEVATLRLRSRYLTQRIDILERPERYVVVRNNAANNDNNNNNAPTEEKRKFTRACPSEGCRGFLSTQWKCGLCETWACPECHEVIGQDKQAANHVCKPENVESAKLIAKDSRPCPSCASLIFKISGCDQMYCIQCHTAFSWRTGKVETGIIHNPHYFEVMRKRGVTVPRRQHDCALAPDTYEFNGHIRAITNHQATIKYFCGALRFVNHIVHVELVRGFRPPDINNNRDLRVKFMLGEIDEDKFKRQLQCKEKKHEKAREGRLVLSMFTTALTDMLNRVHQLRHLDEILQVQKEIAELTTYTNECFEKLGSRFVCKAPYIREASKECTKNEEWRFEPVGW